MVSVTLYGRPWRLLILLLPDDARLAPPRMADTSMGGIISGIVASALLVIMEVTLTLELNGRDHRVLGKGMEVVPVGMMLAGRKAPAHKGLKPLPPAPPPPLTRQRDKGGGVGMMPLKVALSKEVPRTLVVLESDPRGFASKVVVMKTGSPPTATEAVATKAKLVGRSTPTSRPEKVREEEGGEEEEGSPPGENRGEGTPPDTNSPAMAIARGSGRSNGWIGCM